MPFVTGEGAAGSNNVHERPFGHSGSVGDFLILALHVLVAPCSLTQEERITEDPIAGAGHGRGRVEESMTDFRGDHRIRGNRNAQGGYLYARDVQRGEAASHVNMRSSRGGGSIYGKIAVHVPCRHVKSHGPSPVTRAADGGVDRCGFCFGKVHLGVGGVLTHALRIQTKNTSQFPTVGEDVLFTRTQGLLIAKRWQMQSLLRGAHVVGKGLLR